MCYALKAAAGGGRLDHALVDVWIAHVIPTVLERERGSDFLRAYGAANTPAVTEW